MRFDDSCLSLDLVKKKVAQEKEKHSKHSAEGLRNEIGKVGREKESLRKEIAFYRNKINVTKIGIKEVEEKSEALLEEMRSELIKKNGL